MLERRLSFFLILLTFGLLLLGGVVHNTGSSLACPDWPLCYGSVMPEMKGGVAIEHSHRLAASAVGLLTLTLAFVIHKRKRERRVRELSLLACVLVIVQGVLGGLTVIYRLPDLVSTAHLGTSFLFFAVVIRIHLRLAPTSRATFLAPGEKLALSLVTALVYFQSLLGAFVRHSEAGLVCPDIPFCHGSAWPTGIHPSLLWHMAHRWSAVLVGIGVLSLSWILNKAAPRVRLLVGIAGALVILQITLGLLSVMTQLGIAAVTAHLGGAAALWGTLIAVRDRT